MKDMADNNDIEKSPDLADTFSLMAIIALNTNINCHRDGGKSAVKLRKEMGRFGIWVVGLCLMVGGHGIEGETSHHSYRNLQSDPADQPYRTAYHFQPPKNWMNGM
ncbi:hypothetical protein CK203_072084 [Vitis vinifera]|uniref:Uncharacterized protein n=1 Tax=Vitis vinifera TaxID=29760 RepID=A0A438EX82_VITVI|nr:hypothetical protein CK203_072084 [Vitis vinifera]